MTDSSPDPSSPRSNVTESDVPIKDRDDWGPIELGGRMLSTRLFLAPLAGYTQLAFRRAIREVGGVGLATTDLVQSTMLLSKRPKSMQLIATSPDDQPLSVQIFGGRQDELVDAAKWLEDQGFEGLDLNMGCPMAKVTGSGGGARLMCDRTDARDLAALIVDSVSLPVTVKMRLGWDAKNKNAPVLAADFERVGIVGVTIHGRTRAQGFGGSVDRDGIAAVVDAVDRMPVIANGDVRTVDDVCDMRQQTGCDAVAVGRGAMLDPWIFRKLADKVAGREIRTPTAVEQQQFLKRHVELMVDQYGEYGCTLFRKFAAWYGPKLGIPEDIEDRLRQLQDLDEFYEILDQINARHGERRSQTPTAFLKTPNGPIANW